MALVMCGDTGSAMPAPGEAEGTNWRGDAANIESRKGSIMLGIGGEDAVPEKLSFWQKTFGKSRSAGT